MSKYLFERIKNEPDLYYAWQSNIAMAFKDEAKKWETIDGYIYNEDIHQLANNAAKNFLDLLIYEPKGD